MIEKVVVLLLFIAGAFSVGAILYTLWIIFGLWMIIPIAIYILVWLRIIGIIREPE